MKGINKVTLFGNLGADPEYLITQGGPLLKLRLATNESFKDPTGKWLELTEWHSVQVWGPQAERWARVLRKGDLVLVEGTLRTTSYGEGEKKRYKTEVKAWTLSGLAPIPIEAGSDTEPAPPGALQTPEAEVDDIRF